MEQEMYVKKHITEESEEADVYKVLVEARTTLGSGYKVKHLTIISDDDALFKDFPQNAVVSLTIAKPQKKLA